MQLFMVHHVAVSVDFCLLFLDLSPSNLGQFNHHNVSHPCFFSKKYLM